MTRKRLQPGVAISATNLRLKICFFKPAAEPNALGHVFFRNPSQIPKPGLEAPLLCFHVLCKPLFEHFTPFYYSYLFYIKAFFEGRNNDLYVSFIFIQELYIE